METNEVKLREILHSAKGKGQKYRKELCWYLEHTAYCKIFATEQEEYEWIGKFYRNKFWQPELWQHHHIADEHFELLTECAKVFGAFTY